MQGRLLSIEKVNELKEGTKIIYIEEDEMSEVRTLKYNSFYECFNAINSDGKSIPLYYATQESHKYKLYEYIGELI